ncbi:ABC transporter permease [Glaciihabitans arcticus]|uniref:ABC transporter permease n=1 Tax=Glaciihabitans arcticus TaxID=2668039 RepID=A0A4Q9GQZ5_9MICO|nr:ABC transporter permease [Glaciihabitans arcticus]TBN56995.1 ABC transporter permease [Glaciihabitans arcticus]
MNWLLNNLPLVGTLSWEHIVLSVPPVIIGFVVAIPLGWLAHRFRLTRGILLTIVGLLYTIPSLALLVILPPIIGVSVLSATNVIIALSIYAVALMVRSTTDALDSVDADIIQSATAVGYSPWRRFWLVEFPIAGPVLLAGLRVVAVSTVSLVTIGAFVGVRSLGYLFINGLQRSIPLEIVSGIVMTVVIALVFDRLLVLLGRVLMPWTRTVKVTKRQQRAVFTAEATA